MNAVKVVITPALLTQILRLPGGSVVSGAEMNGHYVVLTVEHPELPVVVDSKDMATAAPVYRRDEIEVEPKVEFVDWGIVAGGIE